MFENLSEMMELIDDNDQNDILNTTCKQMFYHNRLIVSNITDPIASLNDGLIIEID